MPTPEEPKAQAPATPTPPITPPAPVFVRADAVSKLNTCIEFYSKFIGKRGYNPHFVLNKLQALGERLNNNDTASDAIAAIKALVEPQEADVVVNQKVVDYDKANPPQPARPPVTGTSPTTAKANVGSGIIKAPIRSI